MLTDPIADMLTRIRNALLVRKEEVLVPSSRLKREIARVLKEEGFIRGYEEVQAGAGKALKIYLAYTPSKEPLIHGLRRVSKPGLRVYVGKGAIPRSRGRLGVAILTTSQGVLTGHEARRRGIGGEVLCIVW
ncbi:MAG: 30S ribosomal protein S8 [Dehalococcoidia bacterium]|nr:30S ribosomal protein S8 [Dehalococcoidia bacterium]MDW8119297.1 30S ribosomal protein S8 [Chloroflexota bacterium]